MCKLFAIVEIENQKNAELFAKKAVPIITESDNHGLGIMRLGERGVHIQRWLEPPKVFRQKQSKALEKYYKALKHQQNEAGIKSERLDAIAIHGRFATCARTLENVHPFFKDGAALMHNGVIFNSEAFEKAVSTCDSEALLSQYVKHKVKRNPLNLTTALDGVGGYYAAIVFNDNGTIDIWRDDTASLFMAHVRGVGVVVATTQEIIMRTAKKCKAYISGIDEILPNMAIRWTSGHSPRITTFEDRKPKSVSFGFNKDITELHKTNVSEANSHWWDQEDKKDYPQYLDDKEAQRIAEWEYQEREDERKLKELQGTIKAG